MRFGRLVATKYIRSTRQIHFWECRCDCGNTSVKRSNHLRSGSTRSCGCLEQENRSQNKKPEFSKEGLEQIRSGYESGLSTYELAKRYRIAQSSVHRRLARMGVRFRTGNTQGSQIFFPAVVERIKSSYLSGKNAFEIGEEVGCHGATICQVLKKNGVDRRQRKYSIDENSFSRITQESAYWAGVMMTDGSVSDRLHCYLGLKASDRSHVSLFRKFLKTDVPVVITRAKEINIVGKMCRSEGMATLTIRSKKLGRTLVRLGITPRKSLTCVAPKRLANNRHFWRGCIDGDGSLCLNGIYPQIRFECASEKLVSQFSDFVRSICPSCRSRVFVRRKAGSSTIYRFVASCRHAIDIAKELYGNNRVSLARKQSLAVFFMRWTGSHKVSR